ncbi:hypothetical protein FJY90_07385 [Candidatus Gottesmanbacteria bacterium]|nr:hypothetical protein [Candidatus Gottesmanbacteria bacterium]
MLSSLLIALSLNFDTFSVAVVEGAQANNPTLRLSIKIGLFFGLGQALMAIFGAIFGLGFKTIISNIDHWIAFILLSMVGGKMIYEIEKTGKTTNILCTQALIGLVIATSIDALIVGITFTFIKQPIILSVCIIGLVSFLTAFLGFYFGEKLRLIFKNKIKIIGGIILITLGIKILIQHLFSL